jgi:23S rRNA (cytosine1962-C5)-methyltransferase
VNTVRINRKGADRILSGHPWVFASDVIDRGLAQPGEAVLIRETGRDPLGVAHYSSTSQITLRLLTHAPRPIDAAFYRERLARALAFRQRVVRNADAYRLVHGEGDELPGLVIDRYGDYCVVQTLSQGMDAARPHLLAALRDLIQPRGIILRNDAAVRKHEGLPLATEVVHGEIPPEVEIHLNGFALRADLAHGQKTGVFLDQRENYAAAAQYARGRALDCFTCTGGFALHLAARCDTVEAIDSSSAAIETARRNWTAAGLTNVSSRIADVFDVLTNYSRLRSSFDTIVLDPPAFTKSRSAIDGALRGYKDINLRALRLLKPGGILITNSCSHHVSEAMLLETVAEAALDAGQTLRVLERRTQSADHPILLTVPETLYLKCLILEVL